MKKIIKKNFPKLVKFIRKFHKNLIDLKLNFKVIDPIYDLNPLKPLIIFDVGANDGNNFIEITKFPWVKVHAFEPTPDLVEIIRKKTFGRPNYFLNEFAVSNKEEVVSFNIAGQGDWGCSSLLSFSDNLDQTWKGRDDLKVTKTIKVNTIKLSSYIKKYKIKRIDFLHIDVQGFDLVALKSLEDFIGIVKRGVVEVPISDELKLYKGQHSKEEMIEFLTLNHFEIYKVTSQQNEQNLFFKRGNN